MAVSECARFLSLDEEIGRRPHGLFAGLRDEPGVHFEEQAGVYVVSRFSDIVHVLRNPHIFSSAHALGPQLAGMMETAAAALPPEQLEYLLAPTEILCTDGEAHARLRRLTSAAFTVAAVRRWEPTVREIAEGLIRALPSGDPVDYVGSVARPLASQTIALILGVPRAEFPQFISWTKAMVDLVNGTRITPQVLTGYLVSAQEFTTYFRDRIRELRAVPADNLLSSLVHARDDQDQLSDEELVKLCVILLSAGSETTVGLLTSAALRLAQDTRLAAALQDRPQRIPGFIEEVLRLDAPAQAMFRTAGHDTVVAGTAIPAGSHLMLLFASGNRDDTEFASAGILDADRPARPGHLSFSHGIHRCLGAALARLEGQIATEELLRSVTAIRTEQSPETLPFRPHLIGPGLQELRLRLSRPLPSPAAS
jgi:cytochrome P450